MIIPQESQLEWVNVGSFNTMAGGLLIISESQVFNDGLFDLFAQTSKRYMFEQHFGQMPNCYIYKKHTAGWRHRALPFALSSLAPGLLHTPHVVFATLSLSWCEKLSTASINLSLWKCMQGDSLCAPRHGQMYILEQPLRAESEEGGDRLQKCCVQGASKQEGIIARDAGRFGSREGASAADVHDPRVLLRACDGILYGGFSTGFFVGWGCILTVVPTNDIDLSLGVALLE